MEPELTKWWKLSVSALIFNFTIYTTSNLHCFKIKSGDSVQFSRLVVSDSLWPHELQHTRPLCPSATPRVHLNPCPLCRWCHPTISSSVSPVAYWAPTNLGCSSLSVLSFCLFIWFMGFSRQKYWSGLPFLSPVDRILSELSTMICPSWVALRGMAHSFTELDKAVVHVIRVVSFLWLWFSVCLLSDGEG